MKAKRQLMAVLCAALAVSGVSMAAKGPLQGAASGTVSQRGELTRQFVLKWGAYVQQTYKIPVGTWAKRMVPNFANADLGNLRAALKRDTFEGAMAQLSGIGTRLSDNQVLNRFARMPAAAQGRAIAAKFGDLGADLTYTPLTPCRILDTRNTAEGAISTDGSRSFVSVNQTDYTAQGGVAGDCGVGGINATAVVLNVTAVRPTGAGYATVYPFNATKPLAASINYAGGDIVNNTVVAKIPNPMDTADFTIYTYAGAHYVADIVGYFAPAQATELECTTATANTQVATGSNFTLALPACATGYTLTGAGCKSNGFREVEWAVTGLISGANGAEGMCRGTNVSDHQAVVQGVVQCCRVPGR